MWRWGALVLALCLVTGFFPFSSTHATVEHCYVREHDRDPAETRCTGRWSFAGFDMGGEVYGVAVGTGWQAMVPELAGGWYEVDVPDSARRPAALTVGNVAAAQPWLVWVVRLLLIPAVAIPVVSRLAARRPSLQRRG